MSLVIVGSFGLVEVRNQTLPKIVDDHPEIGPPGDDASGRSAPCAIIPRHTLLHHSGGRDLERTRNRTRARADRPGGRTVKSAAALLGVHRSTLYRALEKGSALSLPMKTKIREI
ncbi:helix-turn-helix domain-containing protein [Rhodospirillum rubrum]|uniref:helix-turn-helix domain-containing protein n=1 Tax=Rhodospirillum rubrum TaxID=1085 RepID=UPI001FD4EEC0|nr:helix-turn-helix domain-containing protein [Rhodospirillum rubrum]